MEVCLQPLCFMNFLQNNNNQADDQMKWIENRKSNQKPLGLCKNLYARVCVCVCVCVGYSCVLMCVYEKMVYSAGECEGTIYQPLRSGRIWHKVNF